MEFLSMSNSIMVRLRTETRELHTYAETRPLQKSLIQGSLPREVYTAYLGQMLLVHASLESEIRAQLTSHSAFTTVYRPHQDREQNLRADLEHFGIDLATIEALPATQRTIDAIASAGANAPLTLLGMLYVLEGSTNGSKFIAKSIARAYALPHGSPGLSYLDPYGEKQTELWQQFKADMDAVGYSDAEMDSLVEAARHTFQAIADISDELFAPVAA
jgi:heme oxygenase